MMQDRKNSAAENSKGASNGQIKTGGDHEKFYLQTSQLNEMQGGRDLN